MYLLKETAHFSHGIFHILDLAACTIRVQFKILLCSLSFLELVIMTSRALIRFCFSYCCYYYEVREYFIDGAEQSLMLLIMTIILISGYSFLVMLQLIS